MAIIVGTDSYISAANADTYWSNRNNSVWAAAANEDKEKALRFATEYIDGSYDGRWIGEHPGASSQVLAWPRNGALDSEGRSVTGIPQRVADATARLALDALTDFCQRPKTGAGGSRAPRWDPWMSATSAIRRPARRFPISTLC